MPAAILSALILCAQPVAVDGDNLRCGGVNMRIVGINAREMDGSCRDNAPCVATEGRAAREVLARLIRQQVRYRQLYIDAFRRPVIEAQLADGRDLSCALLAAGSVARWEAYWPEGKRC